MNVKVVLRSLFVSLMIFMSGMSTADDIDIYLDPGLDVPAGDISFWPTVMLSFDISPNATATFCSVDVDYDSVTKAYTFTANTGTGQADCDSLIPAYLNENTIGGLPPADADPSVWPVTGHQVKRIELYSMALSKAVDEVLSGASVGLRIGAMFPHDQQPPDNNNVTGLDQAKSNGGFVALGFGPTQCEVNLAASGALPTAACNTATIDCTTVTPGSPNDTACGLAAESLRVAHFGKFQKLAGNLSSLFRGQHNGDPSGANHLWGGAEKYLELYRYVRGGKVFRAIEGLEDFETTNTDNMLEDQPEDNSSPGAFWTKYDREFTDDVYDGTTGTSKVEYKVGWDPTIIKITDDGTNVEKRYIPPPLACDGVNVINFIHNGQSNQEPTWPGKGNNSAFDPLFAAALAEDVDCPLDSCGLELVKADVDAEGSQDQTLKAAMRKMNSIDLIEGADAPGVQGFTSYYIFNVPNPTSRDRALPSAGGGVGYTWGGSLDDLIENLKDALLRILSESSTFTAPALTANALNRTDILNDVYLALFQAEATPFWPGNIKKLRLAIETGSAPPKDIVAGVPSVNGTTKQFVDAFEKGQIAAGTLTYWSDTFTSLGPVADGEQEALDATDGRKVERGGSGDNLRKAADDPTDANDKSAGTRRILTESSSTPGSLVTFDAASSGLTDPEVDFIYAPSSLAGIGWDMGDTLHSRPAAINYGYTTAQREIDDNPDVRLIFGSNEGLLRMVKNTTENPSAPDQELNGDVQSGAEAWAFIPRELYDTTYTNPSLLPRVMNTAPATEKSHPGHPIGIDGPPIVVQVDRNRDGKFTLAGNDIVWAFFGLRRGGKFYYAMDLVEPDNPKLMWKLGRNASGTTVQSYTTANINYPTTDAFDELAQTWSVPQFGVIKIHPDPPGIGEVSHLPSNLCPNVDNDGDTRKDPCNVPVLVFGGGYNGDDLGQGKQDCTADLGDDRPNRGCTPDLNEDDDEGNALFIVHAQTGALIWKLTHGTTGYDSVDWAYRHDDLEDSVAADVKLQDKNGDGIDDTIYFVTTGGELWRINLSDMSQAGVTPPVGYVFDDTIPERWRAYRLLNVGRNQTSGAGSGADRRFLIQPAIASTSDESGTYDAILVGTGDREDPKAIPTSDVMYMFKDAATNKRHAPFKRTSGQSTDVYSPVDLPLNDADLAWINTSGNLVTPGTDEEIGSDADETNGWRRQITDPLDGEKVVGGALIIGGVAFFTTYIPRDSGDSVCIPSAGRGRIYALGIGSGGAVIDLDGDGIPDAYLDLEASGIPAPAISIGTGETGGTDKIYISGQIIDTNAAAFFPTFWRRDEQ